MLANEWSLRRTHREALKGTITSVDGSNPIPHGGVYEEPAFSGVSEGSQVVVAIQPTAILMSRSAAKRWRKRGFSIPGLSFASGADLLVGQDVQSGPHSLVERRSHYYHDGPGALVASQITGQ